MSVSFRDERCRWERGIKEKLKEIPKNIELRKKVDLDGVFRPFGGLMGTPRVTAGGYGLLGHG